MAKRNRERPVLPSADELQTILLAQRDAFRQKFGREPGPDDPVFFDPAADRPAPMNDEVVDQWLLEALQKAGVDRALIHAYQKTGRLVTVDNKRFLTKRELKEWTDAVLEWRRRHGGP